MIHIQTGPTIRVRARTDADADAAFGRAEHRALQPLRTTGIAAAGTRLYSLLSPIPLRSVPTLARSYLGPFPLRPVPT
jgi:hypothetical protein